MGCDDDFIYTSYNFIINGCVRGKDPPNTTGAAHNATRVWERRMRHCVLRNPVALSPRLQLAITSCQLHATLRYLLRVTDTASCVRELLHTRADR